MNNTTVRFLNATITTAPPLWQWDYGQTLTIEGLELPASFEVHFCNENSTVTTTQIGSDGVVTIPDAYLTTGKAVLAYIYLHTGESDGETEFKVKIPVRQRQQPTHETPTPEQQSEIEEVIAALNAGVEAAEDSAEDAEAWAVGQRGGVDVPDTDPTWHNNAKYYAEHGGGGGGGGTTDYTDLTNKPQINNVTLNGNKSLSDIGAAAAGDIPTKVSQLQNDSGFITSAPVSSVDGKTGAVTVLPSGGSQGQVLKKSSSTSYDVEWANESGGGGGTSDYSDLTNKPSINSVTLSGNKTAADLGLGTYSKPSGGIPKTDLADAVQTSLGKADTALQSAPVTSVNSKTGAVTLSASDVGAGTYSKPSGGIPDTDLSSAVQTSLGKANSALQSVPNTYRTASDQDTIDAGKQAKITASGILKGDGSGGVSAAVAGTDYQAPLTAGTDYAMPAQIPTTAADVGAIAAPSSPTVGDFLVYTSNGWAAQSLTTWQGGSY